MRPEFGAGVAGILSPWDRQASPPAEGKVEEAAGEFEALLIAQLLQSMGSGTSGGLFGGEDASGSSMIEFAQEHLAKMIVAGGGLGLSGLIREGVRSKSWQEAVKPGES